MSRDLTGQVAFVTGAGARAGMGRAICLALAGSGASVVVGELRPATDLDWRGAAAVATEIRAAGGKALDVYGDITEPDQVDAMFGRIDAEFGRLDIHVANAASPPVGDRVAVTEMPLAAFDQVQKVNVRGTFLTCRAAARRLQVRGQGGRIVIMSSSMGKRSLPYNGAYAASKFAVNGLMQCLAHELGPHRVTVNSVCPGAIETERLQQLAVAHQRPGQNMDESLRELVEVSNARIPLGHMGTPGDVAETVRFLCSPQARFLTGLSLSVSGGAVMH